MNQARCTIHVKGLDCPTEEAMLRAALEDQRGITGLAFDLMQGTMTVEYTEGSIDPRGLARLTGHRGISEVTGRRKQRKDKRLRGRV